MLLILKEMNLVRGCMQILSKANVWMNFSVVYRGNFRLNMFDYYVSKIRQKIKFNYDLKAFE